MEDCVRVIVLGRPPGPPCMQSSNALGDPVQQPRPATTPTQPSTPTDPNGQDGSRAFARHLCAAYTLPSYASARGAGAFAASSASPNGSIHDQHRPTSPSHCLSRVSPAPPPRLDACHHSRAPEPALAPLPPPPPHVPYPLSSPPESASPPHGWAACRPLPPAARPHTASLVQAVARHGSRRFMTRCSRIRPTNRTDPTPLGPGPVSRSPRTTAPPPASLLPPLPPRPPPGPPRPARPPRLCRHPRPRLLLPAARPARRAARCNQGRAPRCSQGRAPRCSQGRAGKRADEGQGLWRAGEVSKTLLTQCRESGGGRWADCEARPA